MGCNDKSIQVTGSMSDYVIQRVLDEKKGTEFSQEYLKADFFASAVDALFHARRNAGLTQTQVAHALKTKQAAIARLEADTAGSMSLHRYVEFALACGMVPLSIKLVPLNEIINYTLSNPESPCTFESYSNWIADKEQSILTVADIAPPTSNTAQMTPMAFTVTGQEENFMPETLKPIQIQFSPKWQKGNVTTVSSNSNTSLSRTHLANRGSKVAA